MHPTHRLPRYALAPWLLSLAASTAWAMQPLITDDTGTQGSGGHQLELAYGHDRIRASDAHDTAHTLSPTYTYGVTETLDVFASTSRVSMDTAQGPARGWTNGVLGAKWRWYEDEASGVSLAFKPEWVLPVSAARENAGLGTGRVSGRFSTLLSITTPFGAIHANAMVGRERYRASQANGRVQRLSVAPVWDVAEGWKLVADWGHEWHKQSGGSRVRHHFGEWGVVYSPDKAWDWSAGVIRTRGLGAAAHESRTTATLGVTHRF